MISELKCNDTWKEDCLVHSKQIIAYCNTCNSPKCFDCNRNRDNCHSKAHDIIEISEFMGKMKEVNNTIKDADKTLLEV